MIIEIDTTSYNDRRYGKPYIATVDLIDKDAKPRWGNWIGQPGSEGVLILHAEAGAIIMQGQKDFRQPRNSAPTYSILQPDGTLSLCASKAEAYKH